MRQFFILPACCVLLACANQRNLSASGAADKFISTASGLKYRILQAGSGTQAAAGNEVLIRETTSYLNGTVLYSNENSGSPVKVLIGGNQATNAVDEGLRGMREGEIRQLIAPSDLVKRTSYPSNVSADSALVIKIILTKIV